MQAATYHIISGENLLDNYKVHYHFDPVGMGTEMYIPSSGDSLYSGRVINWNNGTTPDPDADNLFKADLGTGTFSGGASGFYNQVTIEHSNDLFSGEFSFLIGAQTTSRQDVGIGEGSAAEASEKGPLTNSNILFSNMGGAGSTYSGWQLGINAANRAYVECNHDFQPLITTYMGQQNPYPHNIWGLVYREGLLKLGLYDINTESFSFETVETNTANLQSTRPWIIGSGINYDPNAVFSPFVTANSGAFAGKMDNFVYFNTGLTDDLLGTVAQSLYSELAEITQPIYDTGDPGLLLGQLTGSGISGEVGVETLCSVTGYLTANVGFTEKTQLTGMPNVGDTYYVEVASRHHSMAPLSGFVKNYRALYYTGGVPPLGCTTGVGVDKDDWYAVSTPSYEYLQADTVGPCFESYRCWKNQDTVTITWPHAAGSPWKDGIAAVVSNIEYISDDTCEYYFGWSSMGSIPDDYDITISNCCPFIIPFSGYVVNPDITVDPNGELNGSLTVFGNLLKS